jgi:hypothetical protein
VMEASARGVPQQRFPSFVTVVHQLWDGDPPGVWQAARRLRDAGRSRDWVLDRLARTWDAHRGDDERYAAALRTCDDPPRATGLTSRIAPSGSFGPHRGRPGLFEPSHHRSFGI